MTALAEIPLPLLIAYASQTLGGLVGLSLLMRHGRAAPTAAKLPLSGYRDVEFIVATGYTIAGGFGAVLLGGLFVRGLSLGAQALWLGAFFQAGLLAGLAHAWWWHLRPEAHTRFTPPPAEAPATRATEPAGTLGGDLRAGAGIFLMALPPVMLTAFGWQFALNALGWPVQPQALVELLRGSEGGRLVFGLIFIAVLLAPTVEELVFRAGLYRWLRERLGRVAGVALSAVGFAAMHLNLAAFLPLAVFGAILALGYERTGRLRAAIFAHALFNLNTIALILLGVTP
jgi:uncharacterized protein